MSAVFKPMSFSLCDENREYILAKVAEGKKKSKTYKASHYLQELITHLREKSNNTFVTTVEVTKPKVKRFEPPAPLTVEVYMLDRGVHISMSSRDEAQKFCDFYESKGWLVGKVKMKCWKAAARNWLKSNKTKQQGTKQFSDVTNQNINNIGEWLNE